jgi:hypothetical protein
MDPLGYLDFPQKLEQLGQLEILDLLEKLERLVVAQLEILDLQV